MPSPIAILARVTACLTPIARACAAGGLSVRILAERPLAERAAVRDVLAVCRVLVNPADWPAWERVLPAHRCGIGAKTVATLRGRVAVVGVTESLAEVARTRPRLAALLQQLADWRAARLPVSQLLETLARDVSGQPSSTGRSTTAEAEARRTEDLAALVAVARRWDADGGGSLGEFLDTLVLSDDDPGAPAATQVLGLTLHAAKGLEFDTVVIVGAEEGLLPHYRHTVPEALAEERRLCYVGMTRARERLVLSVARMRRLWGEVVVPTALALPPRGGARRPAGLPERHHPHTPGGQSVMSLTAAETTAERLPRVSPSRLEAWDRCPAAYRFAYVLRLPQPVADQSPRLLGSVAHALVETYVREAQTTGTPPPLDRLPALARALLSGKALPEATTAGLAREATELVRAWLSRWAVPLAHTVGIEHALAIDAEGRAGRVGGPGRLPPRPARPRGRGGSAGHRLRLEERLADRGRRGPAARVGAGLLRRPPVGVGAAARDGRRRVPLPPHRPRRPDDLRPGGRRRDARLGADDRGRASPRPWPARTIPPPSRPGRRPPAPRAPG